MRMDRIYAFLLAAFMMTACVETPEIEFGVDVDELSVPAEGGVRTVNITVDGE